MQPTAALAPNFLAHLPQQNAGGALGDPADLEALLRELLDHARAAWPQLALEPSQFMAHVGGHAQPGLTRSALFIEDLYLACVCAHAIPAALEAFDQRYLLPVPGYLGRLDGGALYAEETRQILRERLLVAQPDGAPPKIAQYSGRGSLLSWVRTAAVHTARSLQRQRLGAERRDEEEAAMRAIQHDRDPELEYMKGAYRQDFKDAFRAALAVLTPEQRQVIRLHYLDIVRIGAALQVHRATVDRWRRQGRLAISQEVRRVLRERLRLSPAEFDSLAGLVRSQLDVSIGGLLKDGDE